MSITSQIEGVQADSRGRRMRQAEPARVVGLRYVVSDDAHADTMAVLRLALSDAASPLAGREFDVEMPPPHHGQAEFIVLRSRFDAAVQRDWRVSDKCQVAPVPQCTPSATIISSGLQVHRDASEHEERTCSCLVEAIYKFG